MKKLNKKTIALLLCGVLALVTFTSSLAYFSSTSTLDNRFSTAKPRISIVETFNPSDKWNPGEAKEKEVEFVNNGTMDMLMRFKVETVVKNADGIAQTSIPTDGKDPAEPLFKIAWNTADENKIYNGPDASKFTYADEFGEYYYFNEILPAGEATPTTMKFVKFADWAGNEYQGWTVEVKVICEMIQYDDEIQYAEEYTDWAVPSFTNNQVTWSNR